VGGWGGFSILGRQPPKCRFGGRPPDPLNRVGEQRGLKPVCATYLLKYLNGGILYYQIAAIPCS